LELKRRYHDGTTHLLMQPTTFIERLAALVPRPQKNLTVYSGVLAPNAKLRSKVVAFGAPAELPQPAPVTAPEPASEEPRPVPLAASTEPSVGGVQAAATDNPAELPQSAAVTAPELASGEPSQLPLAASPEPAARGSSSGG
jgi:hypothetical protein